MIYLASDWKERWRWRSRRNAVSRLALEMGDDSDVIGVVGAVRV